MCIVASDHTQNPGTSFSQVVWMSSLEDWCELEIRKYYPREEKARGDMPGSSEAMSYGESFPRGTLKDP